MVVNISGIGKVLKIGFLSHDESRNANRLGTVATQDGAELTGYCWRCHENDSLDLGPSLGEGGEYPNAAGIVQSRIRGKVVEKK
jgi:hypothetical protein